MKTAIAHIILALGLLLPSLCQADCQSAVKGSSSLVCELTSNGKKIQVELKIAADGSLISAKPVKALKSAKQDKKVLKKTTKAVNKVSKGLDSSVNKTETIEVLQNADMTLDEFGISSDQLETLQEDATTEQLMQVSDQIKQDLKKTTQDNKKLVRDLKTISPKNESKLNNLCKKKKKLQAQQCVSEIRCDDGIDDDQDGLTDCDDPDCNGSASCPCQEGEYAASFGFRMGNFGTCACYSVAFVQWDSSLAPGATSVTALYINSGGNEKSVTKSEPYDNQYSLGFGEPTLSAPAGSNWIYATGNFGTDGNFDKCSPTCTSLSGLLSNPRVRITCPQ